MFADQNSWKDIQKYYQGTWVHVDNESGEPVDVPALLYVSSVDSSRIILDGPDGKHYGLHLSTGYNINSPLPRKTVYQKNGEVLMLSRIPARMWKKGISTENTVLLKLLGGGWSGLSLSFKRLLEFMEPDPYKTFDQHDVTDASFSAFSPRVAMSYRQVYIDSTLAGYVENNKLVTRRMFKTHLKPFFPNLEVVYEAT